VTRTPPLSVLAFTLLCLRFNASAAGAEGRIIERKAMDTLTAVEMHVGDTLRFTLANGEVRTMTLEDTAVRILLTNLKQRKKGFHGGHTVYAFTCRVNVDGQSMDMLRYVPTQQSFYEPYVINGMRIWFDGVGQIGDLLNENHGECIPRRDARFAVQDATLPICPQELRPWYPNPQNFIDVRESYNGNDVWMGPYQGGDAHGGLDINMPIGEKIWAPIDFDEQFYFNSLARGDNNNRHRGIRRWANGQVWTLQCHHLVRLLVPEHAPVAQGTHYAVAAGTLTGSHPHSHFVFKVGEGDDQVLLDAWILFWQTFENNKRRAGEIRANIQPLAPAKTGQPVTFSSEGSRPGQTGVGLATHWDFGDGGGSLEPHPTHVFATPGVYPVTLVVDDGAARARCTQHITVGGEAVNSPVLSLAAPETDEAPEDLSFRPRSPEVMDVYGLPIRHLPRTVRFTARPRGRAKPTPRQIRLVNTGGGELADADIRVDYAERDGWLTVIRTGSGNEQRLRLAVDAARLHRGVGVYHATVKVNVPDTANSPQSFRVRLAVPRHSPTSEVIVDNADPGCRATPYFWFAPRFHVAWTEGHGGDYLTSGGRHDEGQLVRYTADLAAGRYEVKFVDGPRWHEIPGAADSRVRVRVFHRDGVDTLDLHPADNPILGTFNFQEGTDGHIEFHAPGSTGTIIADALHFKRLAP